MRRSISVDYTNKDCVCEIILKSLSDKSGEDLRFRNYDEIKAFKLDNDLGLDSLDRVELMMELEVEFKINILDEEFESVDSIDDLVGLVYNKNLRKNN